MLLFFFKLGSFSLYDAAETTYGEFTKQILRTGDWLTMHYNGQIIFDKPPLYFWLSAWLSKAVGFGEFAMRLPAAFAGVLTVITTYFLGRKFYNERTGFLAGTIVMTAFQFLIQSRIAELDMLLTLFTTASLLFFYAGYQSNQRKYYLWAYVPMALAMLIKGLLGVALPGCAIFLFLLFKRELPKVREMRPIGGFLVLSLIGLPWYGVEYLRHGKVFLDFALGFLFLSRFQGVVSGHTGPWYYYFLALVLGFAPWSHLLPYALYQTWKSRKGGPELLSLCFILPAFIVFSVAKTKIPNYVLPLYPFLAIMAGKLWDDLLAETSAAIKPAPLNRGGFMISNLFLLIVVVLIIAGVIIAGKNYAGPYQELIPGLLLLAGVLSAGSVFSILFYFFRKYRLSFAAVPFMVFILAFILTTQTLPAVEKYKGEKELGAKVRRVIKANEIIAAYNVGNRPGVVFYNAQPVVFLKDEKEVADFLKKKRGYCFITLSEYHKLKLKGEVLSQQGELAVIKGD